MGNEWLKDALKEIDKPLFLSIIILLYYLC